MNVLIVDDDVIARNGVRKCIKWEEIGVKEVYLACNGKEAIDILNDKCINVVITDIKMPGVDGLELSEYIYHNMPDIKIIIVSAYADFDYAHSAIKFGVKEYLIKPISFENIEEIKRIIKEDAKRFHQQKDIQIEDISEKLNSIFSASDMTKLKKFFDEEVCECYKNTEAAEEYCKKIIDVFFDFMANDDHIQDTRVDIKSGLEKKITIKEKMDYTCQIISRLCYLKHIKVNGNLDIMLEYIKTRIDTEFSDSTLSETKIASDFGLVDRYISDLFEKKYGISLFGYLTDVRMDSACNYLLNTDWGISKVAEKCGYNYVTYFNRKFKKRFGVTPIQYREINRN